MKAIILAAGFGNRMKPLTNNTHKTLLTVAGKTIIDQIIMGLLEYNIFEIIIVTGFLSNQLKDYMLEKFPKLNLKFIHNPRFRETNNIFSLSLALNSIDIDDDVILIESDLIYDSSVIKRLVDSEYSNVALVSKYKSGMDGTVVTINNNIITNVIPTYLQGEDFSFSDKYKTLNIYKFSKEFCKTIFKQLLTYYTKVIDDKCYYELILGILIYIQKETIHAEVIENERWAEVDDPNDLQIAEFMFNDEKKMDLLKSNYGGYWHYNILDFCFIRNMYFPNQSMLAEIKAKLHDLVINYGSKQSILNQKLAYFLLVDKEYLNVLNGVSQIYPLLKQYFHSKRILLPQPTFGEYTRIFQDSIVYSDKVGFDLVEIERKGKKADVIVFVNPNNPSGSLIQTEWIVGFAKRNSEKTILVDESFIDFSFCHPVITSIEKYGLNNIIIVKSLSKALGIPGLRLGYVYCRDKFFNQFISENIPIWNLNSIAEFFLEIILKHRESLKESFRRTTQDREQFALVLNSLQCIEKVYPSAANFILVSFKDDIKNLPAIVKMMLTKYSIYIKEVSDKFDDQRFYIRIAVRTPEENKMFIDKLEECMKLLKAEIYV